MNSLRIRTAAARGVALMVCAASAFAASADSAAQQFVGEATQDGMTEVELGKVAQLRSQDREVQDFAKHMVQDHGKANAELAALARSKQLQMPEQLDVKHQAIVRGLTSKPANEFDAEYAHQMAADHAKAVALFSEESSASDGELALFAKQALSTVREHKRMADALDAKENPRTAGSNAQQRNSQEQQQ